MKKIARLTLYVIGIVMSIDICERIAYEENKHISLLERIFSIGKTWDVEEPLPNGWRYATSEEIDAYIRRNSPWQFQLSVDRIFSFNENRITDEEEFFFMYGRRFTIPKGTKLHRYYTSKRIGWDELDHGDDTLIVRVSH